MSISPDDFRRASPLAEDCDNCDEQATVENVELVQQTAGETGRLCERHYQELVRFSAVPHSAIVEAIELAKRSDEYGGSDEFYYSDLIEFVRENPVDMPPALVRFARSTGDS